MFVPKQLIVEAERCQVVKLRSPGFLRRKPMDLSFWFKETIPEELI
jgi:hypothetical protein